MPNEEEIWVVGHTHTNADKSFSWDEENLSITDADIIIIDMGTLPTTLQLKNKSRDYIDKELANILQLLPHVDDEVRINKRCSIYQNNVSRWVQTLVSNIEGKVLSGGHVVLLLHHHDEAADMYLGYDHIMPFGIKMHKDEIRNKIHYSNKHCLKEYLHHVKQVNYRLDFTTESILEFQEDSMITDNSNNRLGFAYAYSDENRRGSLTLLPSSVAGGSGQLITKIVSSFKKHAYEFPPSWTENVKIAGMDKIVKEIKRLQAKKKIISGITEKLESQKNNLGKYHDLLFSSGQQLEEAVKQAFSLLGFTEINKPRGSGYEDWIIDLKSIQDVKFGVIEVKGKEAKTNMADIGKCHKWVEDYLHMEPSVNTKGIFVSNQFRWESFPEFKNQKKRFEPNELEYAGKREICIIPTYVLFEATNKVLKGQSPNRDMAEQKIFSRNGILESIF